jgi:hypothetical protein
LILTITAKYGCQFDDGNGKVIWPSLPSFYHLSLLGFVEDQKQKFYIIMRSKKGRIRRK